MIEVLIAAVIVAIVGVPLVYLFDKWKNEMDQEDKQEK